jgi:acyl-CoA synthetase (AMP-forming)/AMP-acid ligase II
MGKIGKIDNRGIERWLESLKSDLSYRGIGSRVPTVTPANLMAHAARQLAPFKRPCKIIIMDVLPGGSTRKILKHRLAPVARDHAKLQV